MDTTEFKLYFCESKKVGILAKKKNYINLDDVLIDGESLVYQSIKSNFILTNTSVIGLTKKAGGSYRYVKIPLEMISSFEVHKQIKWIFLILFVAALFAWLIGDFVYDNPRFRVFIIKTVVMSILFVTTFKKALKISSKEGAKVNVLLKDLKGKDVYQLIREIETLKEERIKRIR